MSQHPFEPLGLPPKEVGQAPEEVGQAAEGPSRISPAGGEAPSQQPLPDGRGSEQRDPFWGYSDLALMLFVGFLILGLLFFVSVVIPVGVQNKAAVTLSEQSLIYLLGYGALARLFRVHYDRPFWRSLGWVGFRIPFFVVAGCGVVTAVIVLYIGALIRTPTAPNRITEMLEDPASRVPLAIFGVTLAPLAEELGFRGFLQPLLVRSLAPAPGIFAAAIPFGILHYWQYGNSWRHALLISLAGAAFGWMRHRTGSTMASTLMHASYNALEFILYLAQPKELHH